ncbi:MAG: MBL fold metallo-hydrolase [Bacillota bacterium]
MVTITLIANAGLCIASANTKLLVDALYRYPPEGFSAPPDGLQSALMEGTPPFDRVGYVLFTHAHPDHFDGTLARSFIERHQPHVVVDRQQAQALGAAARCTMIPAGEGAMHEIKLNGGDSLRVFAVRHSGREYAHVTNLCFLLQLEGKRILTLGDADFDPDYFRRMAGRESLDLVIANPLFMLVPKGRQVLFEALSAKRVAIYHMPFERDDSYGMRKHLRRGIARYAPGKNVAILDEETGTLLLE